MPLPSPTAGSTALVTGASSGIGREIARELAQRGHGLSLVARRTDRLTELAAELTGEHDVRVETFGCDLSDAAGRERLVAQIFEAGLEVEILVNNAGFGGHGSFIDAEPGRDSEMVRLNVEAVTDLLSRYVPPMVERGRGAVIGIASSAAFQPMPGGVTYAATKAFVLSQGEALSHELKGTGVSVTTVCPGPVRTEFAEVAGVGEMADDAPDIVWSTPEQVAAAAVTAVEAGKRSVVPGRLNQATALAGRLMPRSVVLPAVDRVWNR